MTKFSSKLWQKALPHVPELESCTVTITERPTIHSIPSIEFDKSSFESGFEDSKHKRARSWKPVTQQPYSLLGIVLVSAGIITVLHIFLLRSNKHEGIIFAPDVNQLPIGQTFCYLYLPTILALLLGFAWTWIDLDVKRLQPFWQLSRKGGAKGKESVFLTYPFDFVCFVPYIALRKRHWPVFSASFAVITIAWGMTPIQSSMFATKTVHRTSSIDIASSTAYLSSNQQANLMTEFYVHSAYNIAWLNETLRPFMTRDGMLAPFGPVEDGKNLKLGETWTAQTRLYSVDINCQDGIETTDYTYKSDNGCDYYVFPPPDDMRSDQYMSTYVGYWYEESEDSYLQQGCPSEANQTFLLQWARGVEKVANVSIGYKPLAATTLYCESSYYQQLVNATVVPPLMTVTQVSPIGPKEPLPADLFNATNFEWGMSSGAGKTVVRGDYPEASWPDATEHVLYLGLNQRWEYLPTFTGFAIAAYQRTAPEYMDAQLLKDSYQAAYRLLFSRRFADVLSSDLDPTSVGNGTRAYQSGAVVLVPAFVYAVEALLGATAVIACILLLFSYITSNNLRSDPANLASIMALVAEDGKLVQAMARYDTASTADLEEAFEDSTLGLLRESTLKSDRGHGLRLFGHPSGERAVPRTVLGADRQLPGWLSRYTGISFIVLQLCVIAALVYTSVRAQANNGLPLPSSSIFINQVVKKYIPMAAAGFFEPIWIVFNRLLCMLLPYEELRKGKSSAARSITLDYHSLPPQAVIARALKAGHVSLTLVCIMALLANVLSVAFNSLLYESTAGIARSAAFNRPYSFPVNSTSIGNESYALVDGKYFDPFYVATSNLTAGTALPPWTDGSFFYMPFKNTTLSTNGTQLRATTQAIGASLDCVPLTQSGYNNYTQENKTFSAVFTLPGSEICRTNTTIGSIEGKTYGDVAAEVFMYLETGKDTACGNTILAGWLRSANTTTTMDRSSYGMQIHLGPMEESWIACKPQIRKTLREVTVDADGVVLSSLPANNTVNDTDAMVFDPDLPSFIASIHKVFSQTGYYVGPKYHNDSYPSDFLNYLMVTASNSSAFLDPSLSPPQSNATIPALNSIYTTLFAITLGINIPKILRSAQDLQVDGYAIVPETRIFVSDSMFILSIVILSLYIIATVIIYARRPWKILPRMPTTIASQIAFFAAGYALKDLKGTAPMTTKGRDYYVESTGTKYGFGRFMGTDGKAHVGIEREPLVQIMKKEDLRMEREQEEGGKEAKGAARGWIRGKC